MPISKPDDKPFKCEFCKHAFAREKTLLVHMCNEKERWLNRDEKYVRYGFMVYRRFYEISYRGKEPPEYARFVKSKMYSAFVKFGRYLLHINAINPEGFVDFLLKTQIPIDRWDKPLVYETYVRDLSKRESVEDAVTRNILLMQQWSTHTGEPWQEFFRKVTPEQATEYIRSGRISPWLLYTAASAENMFNRMSPEQEMLIKGYIDTGFWSIMLDRHKDDVQWLKNLLDEEGV